MITIANPEKYIAGLYERLSNENIEVGNGEVIVTNEDERESGSISTQKLFLRNFCKDNNIRIYDDYTDDGVSGATFDRPDFNRMIKDIENKKINLVIVKDLSRFGRLSSKISYYLEEFFIEKGVRFIAVTDDIDTGHIETSEEMVQFKAFFNEWFLRDTSRKVRNGKRTRAKEGKVMTTYPTYGYKKDPLDYNHYIIDQDIAPIVRRIFMLARNGKTPTEIGKILTDEKTLVPSEVVGNGHTRKDGIKRGWNRNTVKRILQNVTYLGWVSNGNTKKINYKSKKTMIMPIEDRIIKKGMHTPIIDEETFANVHNNSKYGLIGITKDYKYLLKDLIYCRECGKKLIFKKRRNDAEVYCRQNAENNKLCSNNCKIKYSNLENKTFFYLEEMYRMYLNSSKAKDKLYKDIIIDKIKNIESNKKQLEREISSISFKISNLYNKRLSEEINEKNYKEQYEELSNYRKKLQCEINNIEEKLR